VIVLFYATRASLTFLLHSCLRSCLKEIEKDVKGEKKKTREKDYYSLHYYYELANFFFLQNDFPLEK
jgi:hypothetical protein